MKRCLAFLADLGMLGQLDKKRCVGPAQLDKKRNLLYCNLRRVRKASIDDWQVLVLLLKSSKNKKMAKEAGGYFLFY